MTSCSGRAERFNQNPGNRLGPQSAQRILAAAQQILEPERERRGGEIGISDRFLQAGG
jgi:hypothetical protein